MAVEYYGTYLGYVIGPEGQERIWEKPVRKFVKTAEEWGEEGLGLQYSAAAYSTYVLPILMYVAQLSDPPETVVKAEAKALSLMVPGPYRSVLPEDLFQLGHTATVVSWLLFFFFLKKSFFVAPISSG